MPEEYYRTGTYRARDSVAYLVRRLHAIWLARFEQALALAGLTLTQWILLIQLRDGMVRTASDIAHDLQHDSGALTRVIDQLEKRGLVARRRSARDRRVVELALTGAGGDLVRRTLPSVVEQTNAALQPLTRAEFLRFRDYLLRMLEHVEPQRGTGTDAPLPRRRASAARKPVRKRAVARRPARSPQ